MPGEIHGAVSEPMDVAEAINQSRRLDEEGKWREALQLLTPGGDFVAKFRVNTP